MKIEIIKSSDKRLKTISKEVTDFSKDYQSILEEMKNICLKRRAYAAAAPQFGINERFILIMSIDEVHSINEEVKNFPIIFLTANDLEISIVMGIDMGADDYITKPFKARELISRINSVLRRTSSSDNSSIIKLKDVSIDMKQAKVFKDGVDVMLTALEYKILLALALNPSTVFTREKILADIWDVNEEYVNDNTLTVYIKRIREKIEDDPSNPNIIVTVRGIGYKIGDINV